jgi:hypothetical protein
MRVSPKSVIAASVFLFASACTAQEPYHFSDPTVLARLSYDNFGLVAPDKPAHVCFAVSRNRDYRIERLPQNGQTERRNGVLSKEEFHSLCQLLSASEFRALGGDHGGLIRREVESFGAEIPLGHSSWRLRWLNGDDENPFPESVSKVVGWLRRFQPTHRKSFEHIDYPDVCPAGGLRQLRPSVADNSQRF